MPAVSPVSNGHLLVRLLTGIPDARLDALTADGAPEWTAVLSDLGGLAVTVIDTGPGTNRLLGISVTEGTLFFSQTGAGISAYAPT